MTNIDEKRAKCNYYSPCFCVDVKYELAHILNTVCNFFGVKYSEIITKSRSKTLINARMYYVNLALKSRHKTEPIGRLINSNHTITIYYAKKFKNERDIYPDINVNYKKLLQLL